VNRPKKRKLPDDVIVVTTYAQLALYLRKFAEGHLGLLLLLGRPGTGKTYHTKSALGALPDAAQAPTAPSCEEEVLYVEGHVQPFGLYQKLWQFRDRTVVLDDLDRLYADPNCVRILKPLCSTQRAKTISWITHMTRAGSDIPDRFTTTSNVALIANEWRTLNANVRALEDRAIILHFAPSNEEVHRQVGEWFDDSDVYSFIADWLQHIPTISMRHYDKGRRLRAAGFADWRESLLEMMVPDRRVSLMARLQWDAALDNESERVTRFCAQTGCSRPTYYRLKRLLPALDTKPSEVCADRL
jgi:hypothetical protein